MTTTQPRVDETAATHAPQASAAADEHLLWSFEKLGHRVEARTRLTAGGPELRILVGEEVLWSHVYTSGSEDLVAADADGKRDEFVAKGWVPPAAE